MTEPVLVIGASVAGVRTAQALRAAGHGGRVVVVGAEDAAPYDKPALSKQYLAGEWGRERLALLHEAELADIELRTGVAAVALHPELHSVELADGSRLAYSDCVIATGARARPGPWQLSPRVNLLRTLADSDRLRSQLQPGRTVLVVGGSFIGAEVATTARRLGCDVRVVDPAAVPLARAVGNEIGRRMSELHGRHGVATRFGVGVEQIEDLGDQVRVRLSDHEQVLADVVVVGIGAIPNDEWLITSGLSIKDGLLCDHYGRSVDDEHVFAVGDVARFWHDRRADYARLEHWTNAVEMATVVAHNIVHSQARRAHVPTEYVWTDQYDWKIQIAGRPADGPRSELLGSLDDDRAKGAVLFVGNAGELCGAVTVNWPRAMVDCRRALARGDSAGELRKTLVSRSTGR